MRPPSTALPAALACAALLAGCGAGKSEQAAYEACLAAARKDAKHAKASFASREESNIQASTGGLLAA